jgi:TBC domain-containing protein kinase-like protein
VSLDLQPLWTSIQKLINLDYAKSVLEKYQDRWKYSMSFSKENLVKLWELSYYQKNHILNCKSKDRDLEYQFLRLFRFGSLIERFPTSKDSIILEAVADIPPLLRGIVWAAVLDVRGDSRLFYAEHNIDEDVDTDRQLDLDIPRCHQYHELLSTPLGHLKLRRVLKAWIRKEKGTQVYWQGLDSLAACFVTLNFDNEV